ncbi:MAG: APC family permease [Chloroflexota bacterium]
MTISWHKPADRIFRPRRIQHPRLRRILGIPGLFSAGYGDVGSSIYYALGVVALTALGATPIVLAIAGIIYIFNALTYAEGGAMLPEAGGSSSFARHGFNDLIGFTAGWALMLSYTVTMCISAYTIPPYLSYFFPAMNEPIVGTAVSMGIILFLMVINVVGIRESSGLNIGFITIDIITQVTLVILGIVLILIPKPADLFQHMFGEGNWPSTQNLIFGIAIAALCFTGVETVAQLSEETRRPEKRVPQTYILMIVAVLVLFAGISIVALSAMTPQELGDPINGWARDPVAGIAHSITQVITPEKIASEISYNTEVTIILTWILRGIRDILPGLVAILAASILLIATNAGLIGISRLAFNLSSHHQLPAGLSRVHKRFRTPYITIILFCLIAIAGLIPGFFTAQFFADLGALYVFGSLLTFALAHASILSLRIRRPDLPRPFIPIGNITIKGQTLSITAILGLIATSTIWVIIVITQPYSRWNGLAWMAVGLVIYVIYRRIRRIPLSHLKNDSDRTK